MKWKIFFIVFKELSFDEKTKIWQKIADTSFNLPENRQFNKHGGWEVI